MPAWVSVLGVILMPSRKTQKGIKKATEVACQIVQN